MANVKSVIHNIKGEHTGGDVIGKVIKNISSGKISNPKVSGKTINPKISGKKLEIDDD
jgi:hypothetical protein